MRTRARARAHTHTHTHTQREREVIVDKARVAAKAQLAAAEHI
jgi:hypothetical protein